MSVEGMGLGLPEDIEADEAAIRDSATDLLSTRGTMLGYTTGLEAGFRNTANEFTEQRIEDAGLMTGREIFLFGGQTSAEVEFGTPGRLVGRGGRGLVVDARPQPAGPPDGGAARAG